MKFYAQYFNSVEINSTFYRPCTPKTAESWVKRTPDDFEFTLKAWQQFTHKKDLWLPGDIEEFKKGIAPLAAAGKLGCVLFQFPASFQKTPDAIERLKTLLGEFEHSRKAVELRHRSWAESRELLAQFNAFPTFIDEPKFRDSIRQNLEPQAGVVYVRFHGRNAAKWWRHEHRNDRYDYLYAYDEIHPYALRLKEIVESNEIQKAYIFFNNHPNAKAVANAVMMRAELGDAIEKSALPERFRQIYGDILVGPSESAV